MFGCYYFLYLRPFNKHKLELRSDPYTFFGYSFQQKGYQCFMANGKVVISRHVVFDESRFFFSEDKLSFAVENYTVTTRVLV